MRRKATSLSFPNAPCMNQPQAFWGEISDRIPVLPQSADPDDMEDILRHVRRGVEAQPGWVRCFFCFGWGPYQNSKASLTKPLGMTSDLVGKDSKLLKL